MDIGQIIFVGMFVVFGIAFIAAGVSMEIDSYRKTKEEEHNPKSMEELSGLTKLVFTTEGFKFDANRSDTIVAGVSYDNLYVAGYRAWNTYKNLVMVDRETNMPYAVTIHKYARGGINTIRVSDYYVLRNRTELIDAIGAIRSHEVLELDLSDMVYLDDVWGNEDLIFKSYGSKVKVAA